MTGLGLLGLILLSMAWLFFLAGLATHWRTRGRSVGFLSAIVGSGAVFFTIPALAKHGVEVPWPWIWILLPLVLLAGVFKKR